MKIKMFLSAIVLTVVFFTSCSNDLFDGQTANGVDLGVEKSRIFDTDCDSIFTSDPTSLSSDEVSGILLMREEEKMAHDVYVYFFEKYGVRVFDRISISEATHTESVGKLIAYFGLIDPMLAEAGAFSNSDIQNLYNELIAMGSASVEDALATGAFIEEYDIADLQTILEATTNADLQKVYGNLLRGSENHLRAFVRSLAYYGVTYEAQILNADYVAEILSSSNNGGNGVGNGAKGKQGNRGKQVNGAGASVDADADGYCDVTG